MPDLDAIRQRAELALDFGDLNSLTTRQVLTDDVPQLLDEIDRLRRALFVNALLSNHASDDEPEEGQ